MQFSTQVVTVCVGLLCTTFIYSRLIVYNFHSFFVQTLNRCGDSMGTLGHRALLQYIESNDLSGLKTFLDTRQIPVDDRDEVSMTHQRVL